jgi:ketosteroid isomerase-like protein
VTGALPADVAAWLGAFARAVRERDFAAGRSLFDPHAVAFGTLCPRAGDLDVLVEKQWRPIWNATEGFDFDYATALAALDGAQAVVATTWASRDAGSRGARAQRRGRATLVLRRDAAGWRAVHSHFSMEPDGGC